MDEVRRSPAIETIVWGRIEIESFGAFKDAKLWPGGAREWDWSETGTRHRPGVQAADVQELLDHGADVIVLSRGMDEVLQVDPRTIEFLDGRGVETIVAETRAAVERYNELARSRPVGALIHSTC